MRGSALVMLTALWLLGRIACFFSALLPVGMAAAVAVAFPFILCAIAANEIIAARNWRNLMMPVPIGVLGVANVLMHLEYADVSVPSGLGWRLAFMAAVALVSGVGGRIIPAFTRNWLVGRGEPGPALRASLLDRSALLTLHTGLPIWALFPTFAPTGVLLLIASLLNFRRLGRWRGWATRSNPLLAILHVGYGWVALGAALVGSSLLSNLVPEAAAIHAFTAGAIGTMILAVMTRVSLGHTGRTLEADRTTGMIYLAVTLGAVARVAAPFAGGSRLLLLEASALLWTVSFLMFVSRYAPILTSRRIDQASVPT